MPLRDHFHPPLSKTIPWDRLHGGWPMVIVQALARDLPPGYLPAPQVHLGSIVEIDVGTFEDDGAARPQPPHAGNGGVATALWAPPRPAVSGKTHLTLVDEYEVLIYDAELGQRLVAAVEIISPSNLDRPQSRRNFVSKCVTLLERGVCVVVVDLVTSRHFNLYRDVLDSAGQPSPDGDPTPTYAAVCRVVRRPEPIFEAWDYTLTVGQPLPSLPLWIAEDRAVRLDLEATYEDTCRPLGFK